MASPEFPRFDVVSDESDHHFAGKPSKGNSTGTQKKIMQEWKLLDKNLPESIYVRVYETRTDLLRAAIVGAPGTPYHDGLFFFDVYFPSDYPTRPPLVFYRSFGFRVNPNLYADGKVCLSLLNTWNGKKCERWNPNNSNILQVLLSIQALVLNEKPYFNEPGYGAWSGRSYWEKKSMAYNEDVFVLNCKTMLRLLSRPPRNFEPLVTGHLRNRAEFILSACDGYRKGLFRVGYYDPGSKRPGQKVEVSSRFKSAMDQVYGELVGALAKSGASVGHFAEQVRVEKEKKANEKQAAKKKGMINANTAIGKRVVKKLKKIFFLGFLPEKKDQKSKTISVHVSVSQSA